MLHYLSPAGSTAIESAVLWVQSAVLGAIASTIAIIAVATIGLFMLSGRLDLRRGARTILGCFLIFGAPTVAAAFMNMIGPSPHLASEEYTASPPLPALPPPPPRDTNYDPYSGAAVLSRR